MIVIVNGSLGVGKTSVATALHWRFARSVNLDGDALGDVNPFEIYDTHRVTHLYQTLALLIHFHQQHGYHDFVINYVFESAESLEELLTLLRPLETVIHTIWLTCDPQIQAERIRTRQNEHMDWELQRAAELRQIQASAAQQGFIGIQIDTTALGVAAVADAIWNRLADERR